MTTRLHYRINDTPSPRQIDFIDKDHKRTLFGIYELTGDRLKIEIAKPGKPRLKEFLSDKDKLLEGHTLPEFERERIPAPEPVP